MAAQSTKISRRSPRYRRGRGAMLISCLLVLFGFCFEIVPAARAAGGQGCQSLTLQEVFGYDGLLDDILNRPYSEFEVAGPDPVVAGNLMTVEKSFRGERFWGFDPGVDPADPDSPVVMKEARMTMELYLPTSIDFQDVDSAWIVTHNIGAPPLVGPFSDSLRLFRIIFRKLARRGIPCTLFYTTDRHPVDPENPVADLAEQFGFVNNASLQHAAITWMMNRRDVPNECLNMQDLRFHLRFAIAQSYVLTATFFSGFILDLYGPQAANWVDNLKVIHSGGSKASGGVLTSSAIDPRVRGVRIAGNQGLEEGRFGASGRHETDWLECPGTTTHANAPFVKWAYEHRNDLPAYLDSYIPGHHSDRYDHLFILDIVATHDHYNPLGSHTDFWKRYDGLDGNGDPDPTEFRWDKRIVRRPNAPHGNKYVIGMSRNGIEVGVTDVMLWKMVRYLVLGVDIAHMEAAGFDTTTDPDNWSFRVRVTGDHPVEREEFCMHIALSDDRDFRNCTNRVQQRGACIDGAWGDDNKFEEDYFYRIEPTSVSVDGDYRTITFPRPAEYSAFTQAPLIAAFAELYVEGNSPNQLGDDLWLMTEVQFINVGLYPESSCP